jgi:hypothetical protein
LHDIIIVAYLHQAGDNLFPVFLFQSDHLI